MDIIGVPKILYAIIFNMNLTEKMCMCSNLRHLEFQTWPKKNVLKLGSVLTKLQMLKVFNVHLMKIGSSVSRQI